MCHAVLTLDASSMCALQLQINKITRRTDAVNYVAAVGPTKHMHEKVHRMQVRLYFEYPKLRPTASLQALPLFLQPHPVSNPSLADRFRAQNYMMLVQQVAP